MFTSNEHSYNKIAEEFLDSRDKSEANPLVVEFADHLKTGDPVLDLGCGGGIPVTKYLAERGFQVIGIDITENLLDHARKAVPNARFIKTDFMDFESEQKFAGIVAWDSLFHLQYDEQEAAFRKIDNLLDDQGYFLFTHGGSEGEITGEMYGHTFSYGSLGPEKTRALLKGMGFKILKWEVDLTDNGYMKALVQK